jgi:hypothetical protein|tara:strand:- start:482 stop:700 length:219 start_codon:yes stop_codon:yes gene_type:complete
MKQIRLEALKLAVQAGTNGGNIMQLAEEYAEFISAGTNVEIFKTPPEATTDPTKETLDKRIEKQRRPHKARR